jgi:DNA-directed RNA polymerase subunit H (RpoH/RPB5)
MSQSGYVSQIYKSRNNILDILKQRGFIVDNYEGSSITEVHTMLQEEQLDMLVKNEEKDRKVYVKYHLAKTIRPTNIYEYIEDLFNIDEVLGKKDELIIITKEPANDTMVKVLQQIWNEDKTFITIFGLKHLQFNILKHTLVPPHRVMDEDETEEVYQKYNITDKSQLPDISRFSPVAMAIGIRPGELCEIIRPSKTAVISKFYRICSQ